MYDPLESGTDPSQNYIEAPHQPLDYIFHPKRVAVIGATEKEGSVGRTLMQNLKNTDFGGEILPINPKRDEVLGVKCYKSVAEVDGKIDLVVIITPARTVPALIQQCADKKIPAAIIISAGFKELGPPGEKLEQEVLKIARKSGMRIIGPNCLGVMNPILGLNATFAADMAFPGNVAFISQSGAMCTAVLDWSLKEKIGFSSFVSIGSMADVQWGDLINYLGNDRHTKSILIYMESIGDPRSFLAAARRVALTKPIVVIKSGRTEVAAKAAASHTGSMAGSDDVLDAAFKRAGVMRVDTIEELFNMALVLAKQPEPRNPNLTIITNAGGPAVLATDAASTFGAELTELHPDTIASLDKFLPAAWSRSNPVDLLGDADAARYTETVNIVAKDPHTDGLLVVLSPQDMTEPEKTAKELKPHANIPGKPLLASWMGGASVEKGAQVLKEHGIPCFPYPDEAAKTFAKMWKHSYQLKALYETPPIRDSVTEKPAIVDEIIQKALSEGRDLLTEMESKDLLKAYGIPVVETIICESADEAKNAADKLTYPVVAKLHSETITHKTDVGGVLLNLNSAQEVIDAFNSIQSSVTKLKGAEHFQGVTIQRMVKLEGYEIILGSTMDEQFGPVLLFGSGGQLVEVFKDSTLALPPLNATLARRMMEETKIYTALQGVRGRGSVNMNDLETLLVSFSRMIAEQPHIKECDINPLLANENEIIALDARVILHPPGTKKLSTLSIRPYPVEYIQETTLKDKTTVLLRPIRPEDEPAINNFHRKLSEDTVRSRYFQFLSLEERIAHDRLIHICSSDYEQEIAIVAEHENNIVAVLRLTRWPGTKAAHFKLIIQDDFQGKGLGSTLLDFTIDLAKREGIETLKAQVLHENKGLIAMLNKRGFTSNFADSEQKILLFEKDLA
ncbi:MAG: bifunctional acetate--CoA ligase family protein/GNAT family N-acetyltransferase [Chlamydiales bacterium]